MSWIEWIEVKAIADLLRGDIAVAEARQTFTNPADLRELRRMLEEARRFLATPEGDPSDNHPPQDPPPPVS